MRWHVDLKARCHTSSELELNAFRSALTLLKVLKATLESTTNADLRAKVDRKNVLPLDGNKVS